MSTETFDRLLGALMFVAAVVAYFTFGILGFSRAVGVSCLVTAAIWFKRREIGVGVEGRPASFHLRGWPVAVSALLMGALGVAALLFTRQFACSLGWGEGLEC